MLLAMSIVFTSCMAVRQFPVFPIPKNDRVPTSQLPVCYTFMLLYIYVKCYMLSMPIHHPLNAPPARARLLRVNLTLKIGVFFV